MEENDKVDKLIEEPSSDSGTVKSNEINTNKDSDNKIKFFYFIR
jgi:hypothetical protein